MPGMVERGWGRIINLGSIMSVIALAERAPYSSAKAGVMGLTRVLALESAGKGRDGECYLSGTVRHRNE